ncbi:YtzH-like family protein [Virgibacillus xinjiangensis]|uniref:YtzH-like family protein n=1 Tax=Virgibacillus xinjiangensis TaxID=393090 RepID=A0ABV7CUK0_9BACI
MALTVNNQLSLLYDLLDEQQVDGYGQASEYQQIVRLVQSMMENDQLTDEQLTQLLPEIYNYGKQGESTKDTTAHITSNRQNIGNWTNIIQQANLE